MKCCLIIKKSNWDTNVDVDVAESEIVSNKKYDYHEYFSENSEQ